MTPEKRDYSAFKEHELHEAQKPHETNVEAAEGAFESFEHYIGCLVLAGIIDAETALNRLSE